MPKPRLADLKQKLVAAGDFQSVEHYFSGHFGEDPAFMDQGEPSTHEILMSTLAATAERVLGKNEASITDALLIEIRGDSFIHGPMLIGGRPASVIYFDDVGVGLLTILTGPGDQLSYLRFTTLEFQPHRGGQPFTPKGDKSNNRS